MISKQVKRFVELIKSNPDEFCMGTDAFGPYLTSKILVDLKNNVCLPKDTKIEVGYLMFPEGYETNWSLYFGLYEREREFKNLNIVERLFLKRNLKIHLNKHIPSSLLFLPYKAKFLVLKYKILYLFLFVKNILNIKKHAWIISIVLQLLTIGLVLWIGNI